MSGGSPIEPYAQMVSARLTGLIGRVRLRSGRAIALLIVLSLLALAVSLRENLRDDYRHRISDAEEQAHDVTQVVALEIGDAFREIDRLLDWTGAVFSARNESWLALAGPMLTRIAADDRTLVRGVVVHDASGTASARFGTWEIDKAAMAAVSSSMIGRILVAADGTIAGRIDVLLDFRHLGTRGQGPAVFGGREVIVFNADGAVLFGQGENGDTRQEAEKVAQWCAQAPKPGQAAVVRIPGGRRLDVLFRLPDQPLMVAVSVSTDFAEARWRKMAWRDAVIVGGVGLMLLGLAMIDNRRQRRSRTQLETMVQERTQALGKVNRRLVDAERIAHLGHWERDLVTGEGYWSDENFRIYGLPIESSSPELGRFLECIHPDDREGARRIREEVQAGRDTYEVQCRVIRPNGDVRHVHSQAEVVRDLNGRALRLIGTTLDITDLMEAEQRLRESEEKYRTVFEVGSEAICLIDRKNYAVLAANRAARRLYGYEAREFLQLTIFDLSAEPDETQEAMQSRAAFVPLRRHRRKDGSEIYVETATARARLGGDTVLVMAVRDITERVAGAAQLAKTKARLIEAERIAHLGHWEWLPRERSQFWSEEMYRLLGVSPTLVKPAWEALVERLHPEDRVAVAAWPERGEATAREVRVIRPDGEERHVHLTIQATRDDDGTVIGLFGTALDVSDRYAAQQALTESHALLSAVINATEHDMVLLIGTDGAVQVANDMVAKSFKHPVSAIIGHRLESFMPLGAATRRQAVVEQVLATGMSVHLEEAEAGLVFDTHCAPALGADGAIIGVAVFARNITGRKQVEDNLRKLTRAIEQTPLSIVISDLDGIIEYVNPHFTTATGYKTEDVIGGSSRILKSGYTSSADYRAMWRTIAGGDVWHGEFHNRRRDGSLFWERASIAPVRDEQGTITHYVAVKEDVTERKRVEIELLAAKERAEAANIAKSQFLATVSHELRTPLNAVIGFSECLRSAAFGPIGDERYQRYAGNIHDAGSHLLKLINDILDLAHAEAGKFQLFETIVDPAAELLAAVEIIRATATARDLGIELDLPSNLPMLYVDQRAIREIAGALLSNAVKFTPRSGRICVAARVEDNGLFAVRVSDTGIGIPSDQLARVTQPFSQLDADFTREHEGTGVGLALARSMAELHGGHLEIESTPGLGTNVTVRFPCARVLRSGDKGVEERIGPS